MPGAKRDHPTTQVGSAAEDMEFPSEADAHQPAGVIASHIRGRGAQLNPTNRHEQLSLHILGESIDEALSENPEGVQQRTEIYHDRSRTLINKVNSPDVGMEWTINPYRGCEHGCIYCYARPTHENLGFSCGLDFETKIMAKLDAPDLLRKELAHPKWKGETIVMSGVTDAYQPLEAKLNITRRILEICVEARQPVSFITKSKLVLRDLDLLRELNKYQCVSVALSVTTLDLKLAMKMEPRASRPADRLHAIRALSEAGIPVMAMTAPIIPGLNDQEIPALLKAVAEAGAITAGWVMMRLPFQVKILFLDWLKREFPQRAARVEGHIRDVRDGELSDPNFGSRMRGTGPIAEQIRKTHSLFKRRYGLDRPMPKLSSEYFRLPLQKDGQLGLFQ